MNALRDALGELPESVFADLLEGDDAYLLVVDVPGATADAIDVTAGFGRLHIEAERAKDVPAQFSYVRENRSVFLDATFPLPPRVDGTAAEASVDRGVLEVRLPKASRTGGTRVAVSDE